MNVVVIDPDGQHRWTQLTNRERAFATWWRGWLRRTSRDCNQEVCCRAYFSEHERVRIIPLTAAGRPFVVAVDQPGRPGWYYLTPALHLE